ncbi:uncharacterized protein LOC128234448 isoform X2 [Mya arenaria]|nr:uncharacterized protein LOC128234448 isoform X2 [Mya arenaria]
MGISDANNASVETDYPDSTIQPKTGQNQDGNGAEHFQVEPDDKNESGTDESVEEEEQPNRQGKPVDSTGLTPLTSPNNDNDKTLNTSVQTITSNSPGKETGGAESGSKENVEGTGCTHFKTVWGLRPDLLLLTIVVVIAAVIVKFPPGAHQVVTDNPVIQQQLSDIAKQFIAKKFEDIENKIEVLESKVNTNSKTNCEQPSKLDELENNIIKINNILSPSDPDDILHPVMKTKVRENIQDITKIKTDIADVKNNHNALNRKVDRIQSELSEVKEKHKQDDSNLSRDITHIRESVTKNSNANSALSNNVSQVENDLKDLESKLHDTTSKVDAINEKMKPTNDTVSKVRTSAKTATEMVDKANANLKIMEQHLFNKGTT